MKNNGPGAVVGYGLDGVDAFERGDAPKERQILPRFVAGLPVVEVVVVGNDPLVVFAVAAFLALVVVHPGVGLKNAKAVRHQSGIADAGFDMLMAGKLNHELLMRMAKRMANNILGLQAFTQCRN